MFGPLAWLVPIFVALSTFGGVNGILFTSARLFATGAQNKHLPSFFSLFHITKQTPIPSLIFTCATSLIMLFTSDIFLLINYFSQILWLSVAASIAGLLWMRKTKPNMPRPIKVNLILPWTFITCCMVLVIAPAIEEPANLFYGLLITFSGVPVYYIAQHYSGKMHPALGKFGQRLEFVCQILFNSVYVDTPDQN